MAKSIPKVSGMDWIIEVFNKPIIEPDEFTASMIADKSSASLSSIRSKLERMFQNNKLTRRKVLLNGRQTNVYKCVVNNH